MSTMLRYFELVLYCVCASRLVWSLPPPDKPMGNVLKVPKSECRSMMDLVFVLDGSDSIHPKDYEIQRKALHDLVSSYNLGPKESRVGLVVYSTNIAQTVPLTYDKTRLQAETRNMVHPRDGTHTNKGIKEMVKLFKKGRTGVPWVCIVITDGQSKIRKKTFKQAEQAKALGINMFAVGIGHSIDRNELLGIASRKEQVLMLNTFDQLLVELHGLMKVVCPCPPMPKLQHGHFKEGPRSIGAKQTYGCEKGYQAMGKPEVECLPTSVWSDLEFSCLACPPPPPMYGNGFMLDGPQLIGSVREYKCADGYASPTPILSECVEGPKGPYWTDSPHACRACGPPIVPPNAHLEVAIKSAIVGKKVTFLCLPGFVKNGPVASICVNVDGIPEWTKPLHSCIACDPVPKMPHMKPDKDGGTLVNTRRHYTCDHGYHATGPIETICMGEKGATYWKFNHHTCKPCKNPPSPANAFLLEPGNTLVGTIREYQCLKGFQPTGPMKVRCAGKDGATYWEGLEHNCVACTTPPLLPNAAVHEVGDVLVGSVRQYRCHPKFVQTGPIEVGCITSNGGPIWTSAEHVCITCENPPELPNAILQHKGDNFIGSKRRYNCINGFVGTKPGPIFIQCEKEIIDHRGRAFWTEPSHKCVSCPEPLPLDNAFLEPGTNLIGASRNYRCKDTHYATGPIQTTCMPDATWSKPDHACSGCGPAPNDVPFADVMPGGHTIGTIIEYMCRPGYHPDRESKIICEAGIPGKHGPAWSQRNFHCIACKEPYSVNNAVLEPDNNLVGTIRRYTCLPGFLETGKITSTCAIPYFEGARPDKIIPDWSTPVHFCKDCGEPTQVPYADIIPGKKTVGSVAHYVCHKGFVPTRPPNSFCMQNAEWTPTEFKCIDKGLLSECMNLIDDMYNVKFDIKDYCVKPRHYNEVPFDTKNLKLGDLKKP